MFTPGLAALERQQLPAARGFFEQARQLYEHTDFRRGTTLCVVNLAEVALAEGDAPAAQASAQEGLARFHNDADHSGTVAALAVIALCAGAARRYEQAALLLGVTESFSTATGSHILRPHLELIQKLVADAEEAIGAVALQRGRRRGRHMSIDDAIALALDMRAAHAV